MLNCPSIYSLSESERAAAHMKELYENSSYYQELVLHPMRAIFKRAAAHMKELCENSSYYQELVSRPMRVIVFIDESSVSMVGFPRPFSVLSLLIYIFIYFFICLSAFISPICLAVVILSLPSPCITFLSLTILGHLESKVVCVCIDYAVLKKVI